MGEQSVSMDYITGLPKVGDLGSIIVVVDRFSKYATFIAAPKHVTAETTAHLFFAHIVKYWGLPRDIVSDRDSRFAGIFWTVPHHETNWKGSLQGRVAFLVEDAQCPPCKPVETLLRRSGGRSPQQRKPPTTTIW